MSPRTVSFRLVQAGLANLAGAALSAEAAIVHMRWMERTYGAVCGVAGHGHCLACATSLALTGLGLMFVTGGVGAAVVRSPAR